MGTDCAAQFSHTGLVTKSNIHFSWVLLLFSFFRRLRKKKVTKWQKELELESRQSQMLTLTLTLTSCMTLIIIFNHRIIL